MSAVIEITFEDMGNKARYVAKIPGQDSEAELTLSKMSDAMWIADHTGVPDDMRGTGAGKALVERLVTDMRAAGRKIMPLCPFVRAQAARNPEYRDVIQG